MLRFRIRHLLTAVTLTALVFGVARIMDYDSTGALLAITTIFLPCVCYLIAELVASNKRSLRRAIRYTLILAAIGIFATVLAFNYGTESLPPVAIAIFVAWAPQFVLLKGCSVCRSVITESQF